MYIGYVVVCVWSRRVSLCFCELMSLLESSSSMHRGLSNPTRPSLLGPYRDPRISTEVQSASVMRMSPTSALLTPTAFQEECSRRDTLSVIMRPLVSLPIYPDFSEFLAGMATPTSRLNMVTRMGSRNESRLLTLSRWQSGLPNKIWLTYHPLLRDKQPHLSPAISPLSPRVSARLHGPARVLRTTVGSRG